MRFGRALIVGVCVATVGAAAQQTFGVARIAGTVVSQATPPRPVPGAVVTLSGSGANGRSTVTDDQGRFAFTSLPGGRFTITAAKPAYLTSAYGAKAPGRPGTAVVLGDSQAITGLTIVLPHGAAIGGTLRDATGQPAPMMPISVTRVDAPTSSPASTPLSLMSATDAVTDDRGNYRVYGLAPGTYVVSASFRLINAYTLINVPTAAEMEAAFREQQARGAGAPSAPAVAPTRVPLRSYAPTYFPGTVVGAEATRITLGVGEDREGLDFALALVPVAAVDGRVVTAGGALPEMSIVLEGDPSPVPGLTPNSGSATARAGVNGNDTFRLTNVAPGHYTLMARSANRQTTLSPTGEMQSSRGVDPSTVTQVWGSTEIDVRGEDVSGVIVQLQPCLVLSGRVVYAGTSAKPPNPALTRVVLKSDRATSNQNDLLVQLGLAGAGDSQTVSGAARADGTFQLVGIVPGPFHISASAPGDWWLQSVVVGTRDVLDTGLDVTASASDVVLTFSDRHTEVSGSLKTAAGQPVADLVVVAFPAEPSLRASARRLQSVRPASDGKFVIADLPPGEYVLAALTDDQNWQTLGSLESIARSGVKVTLAESGKVTQDLKIGNR